MDFSFLHSWHMETRHWVLIVFLAAALHAHFRGRVRFPLRRALIDYTVLIAPLNSLLVLFSKVRTTPYLDPKDFPALQPLQAHWQEIRDEAMRLNEGGAIRASTDYNDIGFNSFFKTGWKRFHLKWYGQDMASAQQTCPRTVELLNSIPSIKAAMFASLPPGARLVRHRDPYAGSLRYHLGLVTPNSPQCYIDVDGEHYHWRDGEAIMFDETYIHHAENTTDHQRVILFCDVERPVWTPVMTWLNRAFARVVMRAAASQNQEGEPIGGLNKFFFYAYRVRAKAKTLKSTHRRFYYVSKWVLIVGLLLALFW